MSVNGPEEPKFALGCLTSLQRRIQSSSCVPFTRRKLLGGRWNSFILGPGTVAAAWPYCRAGFAGSARRPPVSLMYASYNAMACSSVIS